jgi:heat shock protein HslJ
MSVHEGHFMPALRLAATSVTGSIFVCLGACTGVGGDMPPGVNSRTGTEVTGPVVAEAAITGETMWHARGNEPGWHLEVWPDRLVLETQGSASAVTYKSPTITPVEGGKQYAAGSGRRTIKVTVIERVCGDGMTGMPYPRTVEVVRSGAAEVLRGCGGEPATLLQGEWRVQRINDEPVTVMPRATLIFGLDGRVTGKAFCNTYSGGYTLTGEGLDFKDMAATRMACMEPLDGLEQRFMAVLTKVQRFDITADGALMLHADDGGTIMALRSEDAR